MWQNSDPVAFQIEYLQNFSANLCTEWDKTFFNDHCYDRCPQILLRSKCLTERDSFQQHDENTNIGNCFVMNLMNLAIPSWEEIDCDKPFAVDFFCQVHQMIKVPSILVQKHPDSKSCLKEHILKNNTCYHFFWYKVGTKIHETCPFKGHINVNIENFQYLFDAVIDIFPPIFSSDLKYVVTYKRYWNTYSYNVAEQYSKKEGIYICVTYENEYLKGDNLFRCRHGIYISYIFVCNGEDDCPGDVAFDEVGCECNATLNYKSQCKLVKISSERNECSNFYFKDHDGTCKLYGSTFVNGKVSDISIKSTDDQFNMEETGCMNKVMKKYESKLSCNPQGSDENSIYEIKDICLYKLNEKGQLLPCNKGEHLQNCETFECNMMFKCPNFYCVPWQYTCDGKWDCPSGYDESIQHQCGNRTCVNMFKCKMSLTCIHLGDVCNGFIECQYGDDEYSCLLKNTICPVVCQCLGFVIRCYDTDILDYTLPVYFPYSNVAIINCRLFIKNQLIKSVRNVSFLSIIGTDLKTICPVVSTMEHVVVFDANNNSYLSRIQSHCFKNRVSLKIVKLNNNILQHIEKFAFHQLTSLLFIDLSNNLLTIVPKLFIILSNNVSFLLLENNPLDTMKNKATLGSFNIEILTNKHYSLCCFEMKNIKCSVKKPWFMSCSNLLLSNPIKFAFYFITITIVVSNIWSICLGIKCDKANDNTKIDTKVFNFIVTAINIVDITGSIPLCILWVSDLYFENDFVLIGDKWKCSILCFISGGIYIHFVLASSFLHNLLSLGRYMVVKNPFDTKFKNSELVFRLITVGYLSTCLFALLTTILFWLMYGTMTNVYCYPFFDPSKNISLVEYLTFIIINIQILTFLLILVVHIRLVVAVSVRRNSKKTHTKSLIIQIMCITCSYLLCWIPDVIIYVIIYFMEKYPVEMILWKLVCISPLNSILIPTIMIIKRL